MNKNNVLFALLLIVACAYANNIKRVFTSEE